MTIKKGKLPVWLYTGDAYLGTFTNLPTLARVALVPFFIAYAAAIVVGFVAGFTGNAEQMAIRFSSWNLAAILIQWFFSVSFIVSWHRFVLLGPDEARTTIGIDLTKREVAFFGYAFVLFIVLMGPYYFVKTGLWLSMVTTQFSSWLIIPLILSPIYMFPIISRLSLVLPATAVENQLSLIETWVNTRGVMWRVTAVALLCSIPFSILYRVVFWPLLEGASESIPLYLLIEIAILIVNFLHLAVVAAGLSLMYRWIIQRSEQQVAEQQPSN